MSAAAVVIGGRIIAVEDATPARRRNMVSVASAEDEMDHVEQWIAEHLIASRFVAALEAGHDHVAVTVSEVQAAFGDDGSTRDALDRLVVPWSVRRSREDDIKYIFQQEDTTKRALLSAERWMFRVAERLQRYLA